MLGRTPPARKRESTSRTSLDQTEQAGQSVRRSIGEWERSDPKLRTSTSPKKTTELVRTKPKVTTSQVANYTNRGPSAEETVNPPGHANRTLEARACVTKAKRFLSESRNLRTDIKSGVTQAIERLYELVKEADAEYDQSSTGTQAEYLRKCPKLALEQKGKEQCVEEGKEKHTTDLIKTLQSHEKLIQENSKRMEQLQMVLEKQEEVARTTYASVVAGQPPTRPTNPNQTALHSVVVSSKHETETGEEVLNKIREVLDAKTGKVKVEKVRKAKNGKVILGCKTREDRERVKAQLTSAEESLTVVEVENQCPQVVLKGVLNTIDDETLLLAIKAQNTSVFKDIDQKNAHCSILYRKRTRNPNTGHIVMRVAPLIWQALMRVGELKIDLQTTRVEDHSPLVQCSVCLGYGHGRRFCTEKIEVCSHCGGPHKRKECAEWLAGSDPDCRNCKLAKMTNTNHNAFSNECQIRSKWDALARSKIAYSL